MNEESDLKSNRPASFLWTNQWIRQNDSVRIFGAVLGGEINSRRDVVNKMGIRSTSVSEYVGKLVENRLLSETISDKAGRGRPTVLLTANPNRLLVETFMVVSQSLHAFYVNLAGELIIRKSVEVGQECDNAAIIKHFKTLHNKLLEEIPEGSQLAGVAFSLSGLVNTESAEWIFASRWPKMRHLKLAEIFPEMPAQLVMRSMDAELSCRLTQTEESTILIHWGYGIGMAYGQSADSLATGEGGFGEIGHWRIMHSEHPCLCGRKGCLETQAALWAIGAKLLGEEFNNSDDEVHCGELLNTPEMADHPQMKEAIHQMTMVLANVCRTFFPKRVIITGPFVKNEAIWEQFSKSFEEEVNFYDLPSPKLIAGLRSLELSVLGVAAPILKEGLLKLIKG